MQRIILKRVELIKALRILYAACAFSGALVLHQCGNGQLAFAQVRDAQSQHYADVTQAMGDYIKRIDDHLTVVDARNNLFHEEESKRLNEESDRISIITGVGVGVSATLGVLQILTMLAERKKQI